MAVRWLVLFGTMAIATISASDVRRLPIRPPLRFFSEPMLQLEKRIDQTFAAAVAALRNALPFGQPELTDGRGHLPAYIGTWTKTGIVNADEFLDKAMGVPWMKRRAAITGKQTQRLTLVDGHIVRLAITDLRGTKTYDLIPDGKPHKGNGFMSLPVRRPTRRASCDPPLRSRLPPRPRLRPASPTAAAPHDRTLPTAPKPQMENVVVARAGGLDMEERYSVHLGGPSHLKPCKGSACPVVLSRREVVQGKMVVAISRQLPSGETVGMKTVYSRVRDLAGTAS
jgi:hypothetical protein